MASDDLWDRRPDESAQAYEAAGTYFRLGADRSLVHVGQKLSKSKALMQRWSSRHDWVVRASAYDAHLAAIELAVRRREAEASAKKWADRAAALRERRFAIAEKLLDRAELMLATPITRKRIKGEVLCKSCAWKGDGKKLEFPECPACGSTNLDGGKATELVPAKWTFDTARKFATAASGLAEIAVREDETREGAELENGAVYEFENEDYEPPK